MKWSACWWKVSSATSPRIFGGYDIELICRLKNLHFIEALLDHVNIEDYEPRTYPWQEEAGPVFTVGKKIVRERVEVLERLDEPRFYFNLEEGDRFEVV